MLFLGAVVLAGGLVRLVRAARQGLKPPPSAQAALTGQRLAVDSASAEVSARRAANRGATGGATRPSRRAPRAAAPLAQARTVPPASTAVAAPRPPIDVDRATTSELETLPRIGPALAARIVAERDKHGPFGSLAALDARVKGIGPAMTKALEPLVTFSGH